VEKPNKNLFLLKPGFKEFRKNHPLGEKKWRKTLPLNILEKVDKIEEFLNSLNS